MAPDFFEPDYMASDADLSGQPETMTYEPQPALPRLVRRSLFQIVCIDGAPKVEPPTPL
jgi:hypothetical protein